MILLSTLSVTFSQTQDNCSSVEPPQWTSWMVLLAGLCVEVGLQCLCSTGSQAVLFSQAVMQTISELSGATG